MVKGAAKIWAGINARKIDAVTKWIMNRRLLGAGPVFSDNARDMNIFISIISGGIKFFIIIPVVLSKKSRSRRKKFWVEKYFFFSIKNLTIKIYMRVIGST